MKLGAVFPQTEIGSDPGAVGEFARAVERLGYDLLLSYDHVLGANPNDPDFDGPYDNDDPFHEPLTTFAYLAGVTETLTLATAVLVVPQRQTALVAKQAAEVDVLSGGRLRLGVGVGWNDVEYEALGTEFRSRGARIEEQVEVLRRLWTDHLVEFDGRFHHIPDAGINPRPTQRPIPVWMGGGAEPVLRRAGRLADGWLPPGRWRGLDRPLDGVEEKLASIREHARRSGRDPDDMRVVPRLLPEGDPSAWVERATAWRDLGATHLAVDTVGMDLPVAEHVETAAAFRETMVDAGLAD